MFLITASLALLDNDITVAKQANALALWDPLCVIIIAVYYLTTSHAWKPYAKSITAFAFITAMLKPLGLSEG